MKIGEVIERVGQMRQNSYDRKEKIRWLSRLDFRVQHEIIDTHLGAEKVTFTGYAEDADNDTELLVPAPYDEMYEHYLIAQIEYADQQEDRYNNAIDLFDQVWNRFAAWYNRTHMPKPQNFKF